jgi:hypothetical protein
MLAQRLSLQPFARTIDAHRFDIAACSVDRYHPTQRAGHEQIK